MGQGVIDISARLLRERLGTGAPDIAAVRELLHLPPEYRVVDFAPPAHPETVRVAVEADHLPPVEPGCLLHGMPVYRTMDAAPGYELVDVTWHAY